MAAKIAITGNLTKDPELKDIGSQKACVFSVAVRTHVKKDGAYKTDYYDCTYFGKMGEAMYARAQKGTGVTVWGSFASDAYMSGNEPRAALRINVDAVDCMSRLKESGPAPTRRSSVAAMDQSDSNILPF